MPFIRVSLVTGDYPSNYADFVDSYKEREESREDLGKTEANAVQAENIKLPSFIFSMQRYLRSNKHDRIK